MHPINSIARMETSAFTRVIIAMEFLTVVIHPMKRDVLQSLPISVTTKNSFNARHPRFVSPKHGSAMEMLTVKMDQMNLQRVDKLSVLSITSNVTTQSVSSNPGSAMVKMTVEMDLTKTVDMLVVMFLLHVLKIIGSVQTSLEDVFLSTLFAMTRLTVQMDQMKDLPVDSMPAQKLDVHRKTVKKLHWVPSVCVLKENN